MKSQTWLKPQWLSMNVHCSLGQRLCQKNETGTCTLCWLTYVKDYTLNGPIPNVKKPN